LVYIYGNIYHQLQLPLLEYVLTPNVDIITLGLVVALLKENHLKLPRLPVLVMLLRIDDGFILLLIQATEEGLYTLLLSLQARLQFLRCD
jgi:hypothetical protein